MKAINQNVILICLSLLFVGTTSAQDNKKNSLKKHELGITTDYNSGRIHPGIQYYFSLSRTQQLGASLNYLQYDNGESMSIFTPQLTFEYRFKKNLINGLNAYAAPLLTYRHQISRIKGNTIHSAKLGLGINTGLEYDFSKNNVPLVIGGGIKAIGYYGAGRATYQLTPSVSLRIKF